MTPALIMLIGTLLLACVLKAAGVLYTDRSVGSKSDSVELPALACEALVTRVFEQRLVDAGIIAVADMTTCDDYRCKDCQPTHQAKTLRLQQEHKEAEAKRKLRLPAPGSKKTLTISENGRHKREIPWPNSVPEFASIRVEDDNYRSHTKRLVFIWIDPYDGKKYSKTMLIPVLTDLDIGFTEGSKPVVDFGLTKSERRQQAARERKSMAGKSRYDAIEELRKNPPRPPKGSGAGSPMTPERRREAVRSLTRRR